MSVAVSGNTAGQGEAGEIFVPGKSDYFVYRRLAPTSGIRSELGFPNRAAASRLLNQHLGRGLEYDTAARILGMPIYNPDQPQPKRQQIVDQYAALVQSAVIDPATLSPKWRGAVTEAFGGFMKRAEEKATSVKDANAAIAHILNLPIANTYPINVVFTDGSEWFDKRDVRAGADHGPKPLAVAKENPIHSYLLAVKDARGQPQFTIAMIVRGDPTADADAATATAHVGKEIADRILDMCIVTRPAIRASMLGFMGLRALVSHETVVTHSRPRPSTATSATDDVAGVEPPGRVSSRRRHQSVWGDILSIRPGTTDAFALMNLANAHEINRGLDTSQDKGNVKVSDRWEVVRLRTNGEYKHARGVIPRYVVASDEIVGGISNRDMLDPCSLHYVYALTAPLSTKMDIAAPDSTSYAIPIKWELAMPCRRGGQLNHLGSFEQLAYEAWHLLLRPGGDDRRASSDRVKTLANMMATVINAPGALSASERPAILDLVV